MKGDYTLKGKHRKWRQDTFFNFAKQVTGSGRVVMVPWLELPYRHLEAAPIGRFGDGFTAYCDRR